MDTFFEHPAARVIANVERTWSDSPQQAKLRADQVALALHHNHLISNSVIHPKLGIVVKGPVESPRNPLTVSEAELIAALREITDTEPADDLDKDLVKFARKLIERYEIRPRVS